MLENLFHENAKNGKGIHGISRRIVIFSCNTLNVTFEKSLCRKFHAPKRCKKTKRRKLKGSVFLMSSPIRNFSCNTFCALAKKNCAKILVFVPKSAK